MSKAALSAILLAATTMLAGCNQQEDSLRVDEGWVRLAAAPGRPAAAYFTIHGGDADTRLLSVTTDVAIRSEMHDTTNEGGVMKMAPIDGLDVPADSTIKFAPGGKHLMLFDLNPGIQPNKYVGLVFTFANGERIEYDAIVRAANAPNPKS